MNGTPKRILWTIMIVLFGTCIHSAFATDEALTLSGALSQVKLFSELTDTERDALKAAASLRHCKAGERIIEQRKILDSMHIILDGQGEVRVNGEYLLTLSGQFLVGEIEFLDSLPASADVILLEEADVIELNNQALIDLMEKHPRLGYVLMREIAKIEGQRLRATDTR
jgi:CRP-like cAMP-binding protein